MTWETNGACLCNQKDYFITPLPQLSLNLRPFFFFFLPSYLYFFPSKWKKAVKRDQSFCYQNGFLSLPPQKYIHIHILLKRLYKCMSCFHYLLEQHLRILTLKRTICIKKYLYVCSSNTSQLRCCFNVITSVWLCSIQYCQNHFILEIPDTATHYRL